MSYGDLDFGITFSIYETARKIFQNPESVINTCIGMAYNGHIISLQGT